MAVLFCDTNCELWYTRARELGYNGIRMPYTIDNTEYYYDLGEATDFKKFYDLVRAKHTPITSALNSENYREYFEPFFKQGEEILYISFSSKMSGTFDYMDVAVKELSERYPDAKFTRFDTKNISMGAGMQVYLAGKYFREGHSVSETVAYLEKLREKIGLCFMVDDLNHLKRGGRLSAAAAAFGTLLDLKPVLKVSPEGALTVASKEKGRKSAISYMMNYMRTEVTKDKSMPVVVLSADCDSEAEILIGKIKEEFGEDLNLWVQPIGPVVGTHCGPGTLGLIFVKE